MDQFCLTEKQQSFVKIYSNNGLNGAAAYREAYSTDNKNVAKTEACKLLQKPKIKEAINMSTEYCQQLARDAGLSKGSIFEKLKQIIDGNNVNAALSAIKLWHKFCAFDKKDKEESNASYQPIENKKNRINFRNMSEQERKQYKQKRLAEMDQ